MLRFEGCLPGSVGSWITGAPQSPCSCLQSLHAGRGKLSRFCGLDLESGVAKKKILPSSSSGRGPSS